LGWGGIRGWRVWHGTYARHLEALPDGMHSQSGWEGRIRAMSRKGTRGKRGEGDRATAEQRAAREIAVASGERRRRRGRRCTGRGWLQARVGRQLPTLRSHREIARCRSSDNHVKFLLLQSAHFCLSGSEQNAIMTDSQPSIWPDRCCWPIGCRPDCVLFALRPAKLSRLQYTCGFLDEASMH